MGQVIGKRSFRGTRIACQRVLPGGSLVAGSICPSADGTTPRIRWGKFALRRGAGCGQSSAERLPFPCSACPASRPSPPPCANSLNLDQTACIKS